MAALIKALYKGYKYLNEYYADPRVKDWFLMGSPWPALALLGSYIYFVQKLGPRLMANREPLKIDRIMQAYNIFQVLTCAYLFYKALVLWWLNDYSLVCEPVDYSNTPKAIEIARTVWMYFMTKILDLLDTVFFVLRKKNNQVTFLHLHHHIGMVICTWIGVKYLAGGHGTFIGVVNLFVHIVMYSHYFVTSLKVRKVWWKKYITQLQLMQFVLILLHFSQLLWVEDCGFPLLPAVVFIPQNLFMIILFSDFYYKTYIKKKPAKSDEIEASDVPKNATMVANGKSKTQ